ncbi:hypothetical protein DL96DRAFT_1635689 [Flagelloscypha sp. PMI_526]|nr:hypothetical protein DL96DRAFT_1635689 [Flagelloscypha sp. PMI_526]
MNDDTVGADFINRELLPLVPQMSALEHLQIIHSVLRPAAQWPLCYRILASESFRLTTLSLKLEALDHLALQDTNYPRFPVLRVLRVDLLEYRDFEHSISKLLSDSPLLEEVDYTVNIPYGYLTPPTTAALPQSPLHPDLRCFKWTILSPHGIPKTYLLPRRPFSHLLTTQAVQLVNVTLNPVPSMGVLLWLDLTRLIELRINFDGVANASSFFYHLQTMTQLETLEMIGSPEVWDQKGWEIHHTLKNLYVHVWINQFVRSLDFYRAKAPNMEKLVVLLFAQEWHRKDFKIQLDVIVSELKSHRRLSSLTTASGKLWDFGIASDNWKAFGIWHFTKVLRSVASNIPTIWSFYGTRKLELWKDMEKDVDKRWVGELWNRLPTLYN